MNSRLTKALLTITAVAALGVPAAQASHGADDPAGHVRHSATESHRSREHARREARRAHEVREASEAGREAGRHGADDGPAHS